MYRGVFPFSNTIFLYFRGLGSDLFIYGPVSLFYLCYCQINLSFCMRTEFSSHTDDIQHSGEHFQSRSWQPFLSLPFLSARNTPSLLFLASVSHSSLRMRTRCAEQCASVQQNGDSRSRELASPQLP